MAFSDLGSLGGVGSTANNQVSLALSTAAAVAVGNLIVVVVAVDNPQSGGDSGVSGVTDTGGNTYTKAIQVCNAVAAQGGASVSIWYSKATTGLAAGATITATFSNATFSDASAMTARKFGGFTGTIEIEGTAGTLLHNTAADPGSLNVTTSNIECLRVRGCAVQVGNNTNLTPTASWTAWANGNSATTGTTGEMCARAEHRIFTGTGAASDPTYVSAISANAYVAFKEVTLAAITGDGAPVESSDAAASTGIVRWIATGAALDGAVDLLLHMDGADGATTIPDSGGYSHTVTAHGAAQIDTGQLVFAEQALQLASAEDYITPDTGDYAFGTGDFCVDMRVRLSSVTEVQYLYDGGDNGFKILYDGALLFESAAGVITGGVLSINTSYHVAATRASALTRLWLNGLQQGSTLSDTTDYGVSAGYPRIGGGVTEWWQTDSVVDLDLENGRYYVASPTDFLSCTRASTGYAQTAAGTLTLFAANTLRITDLGLLVEDARTNICNHSQDFQTVAFAWTFSGSLTVTNNVTTAPDGTMTAASFIHDGTNAASISSENCGTTCTNFTHSVYLKAGSYNFGWLCAVDLADNRYTILVNLSTGAVVGTQSYNTPTLLATNVEVLANGWYRLSVTLSGSIGYIQIGPCNTATPASWYFATPVNVAGAAGGIYAWGAQVEIGTFASSYIPTTTAGATRAADAILCAGALSSTLSDAAMSALIDVKTIVPNSASWFLADQSQTKVFMGVYNDNNSQCLYTSTIYAGLLSPQLFSTGAKVAIGHSASGRSTVGGGGTVVSDAETFTPSASNLVVGKYDYAYYRRLTAWNRRLSDVELQTLTSPTGTVTYDAATNTWANAVATNGGSVSAGRKIIVNNLISSLKTAGIWTKLDRLWLYASENSASALTDLKATSLATAISSPTFTTDRGYTFNGTSSYINTEFNPATAGGSYTLNSASLGVYARQFGTGAFVYYVGIYSGAAFTGIYGDSVPQLGMLMNDAASSGNVNSVPSLLVATRTASNARALYVNGVLGVSETQVSTSIPSFNVFVGARNNQGSPDTMSTAQISAAFIGGGLTATEVASFSASINTYMSEVGARSGSTDPAVDLDFVNGDYFVDAPTGFLSCTRASIGYAETVAGTLTQFAANTLRITDLGLLVEDARTNHVPYSETFDASLWTWIQATVTANSGTAPNGMGTAAKLIEDTNLGQHNAVRAMTVTFNGVITFSVYGKAATRTNLALTYWDQTSNAGYAANFDLMNGVVSDTQSTTSPAPTNTGNKIEAMGNGWYRCSITVTAGTAHGFYVGLSDSPTPVWSGAPIFRPQYTGDGASHIYVWGAQVEAGAFASSYIPTTSAAATRAADVVTATGALNTGLSGSNGSALADIIENHTFDSSFRRIIGITTGDGRTLLCQGLSDSQLITADAGAVNVLYATLGNSRLWSTGAKSAVGWNGSGRSVVGGGGTVLSDAFNAPISSASIGSGHSTSIFGYFRRLTAWNTRLADATLQELTVP
jgi:hypothetical protein